jgi:hypothetical protein
VGAAIACLLLTACESGPSSGPTPIGHDPAALIGSWTVDEDPGAILRIEPDRLSLSRPCGELMGSWKANAEGQPAVTGKAAPPLPRDLAAMGRDALVGRWVPTEDPRRAYVELRPDGSWDGSDGCNGQSGRWVAGPRGAFLATTGLSTLVACRNVPLGSWLGATWRAGLDRGTLVLLDAGGQELGRLRRVGDR